MIQCTSDKRAISIHAIEWEIYKKSRLQTSEWDTHKAGMEEDKKERNKRKTEIERTV